MEAVLRPPLRRLVSRFESIHAAIAAELALASSGTTTPFPSAIFVAYNNCAGLTGLGSASLSASPSTFFGACSLRNFRQIDIDVLQPGSGLMPFCRTRLSAKRFIAGVGGYPRDAPARGIAPWQSCPITASSKSIASTQWRMPPAVSRFIRTPCVVGSKPTCQRWGSAARHLSSGRCCGPTWRPGARPRSALVHPGTFIVEVPGAAAAGCGHDGIHRHHADVGQPEGALPRVHRHHVSQDQRGRSGAVFSRIGGCDAAAGASAPGRDRNPPFTASVPPPVQRAPPAAYRRRC